jgi:hypothetical protein
MIYLFKDMFDTTFTIEHNEATNDIKLSFEDYSTGTIQSFYLTKKEAYQLSGVLHHLQKEIK